jgi:excisionase family DNA binding protein
MPTAMTITPRRQSEPVTVPPELARPLVRLCVLGARELQQRDGGLALVPGLADLLSELDRSGFGRPFGSMTIVSSPLTGSRASSQLTVGEAADRAGLSPRHVRRLADGRLIARKAGGTWLIDAASLADYGRQRIA